MGVYLFKSVHEPWFKAGHFQATPRKPNAYYRVAGRGFYSVVHPECLDGRLGVGDLELVRWYPTLTRKDETRVHRACATRVGEFHPLEDLDTAIALCEGELGAQHVSVTSPARRKALAWGARRAAAARRRRDGRRKTQQ